MTHDLDMIDPVSMIFDKNLVRQKAIGFATYRQAIVAVMELAREDRESAVICGRWNTMAYCEIAAHYGNLTRLKLLNTAPAL